MARGGTLAARGGAALHEHDAACARVTADEAFEERPPVVDAFDVREADRGRVVAGVPVEIVGDARPRPRFRPRPRGSHPRRSAPPSSRTTTRSCPTGSRSRCDRPAGTARRSARRACAGVETTPWPFGPASRMPSSSASATRSLLRRDALRRRPRRNRRSSRNAARTPRAGARAQQVGVRARGRADEDEIPRTLGQLVDRADGSRCRAPASPSRFVAATRPRYPTTRMLCSATKPNLPGWRRRARHDDAAGLEERVGTRTRTRCTSSAGQAVPPARRVVELDQARRLRPACRRRR